MRVRILGRYWFILRTFLRDCRGVCDDPKDKEKCIRIHAKLPPLEELEVTIHEIQHAASWQHDEAYVTQLSHDMARILWRLGWRKAHPPSE